MQLKQFVFICFLIISSGLTKQTNKDKENLNNLVSVLLNNCGGNASKVAIFELNLRGGIKLSTESGKSNIINVSKEEASSIVRSYKTPNHSFLLSKGGIIIDGQKFNIESYYFNVLIGKRIGVGQIIINKSNNTLLIALVKQGGNFSKVEEGVQKTINYLNSIGK